MRRLRWHIEQALQELSSAETVATKAKERSHYAEAYGALRGGTDGARRELARVLAKMTEAA